MARWLLGFTAKEWWDMHAKERIAYERGIENWLPRILFGADAVQPKDSGTPVGLGGLPGGSIVRAG